MRAASESAPIKSGINGFGRIGRLVMRVCLGRDDVEVVAGKYIMFHHMDLCMYLECQEAESFILHNCYFTQFDIFYACDICVVNDPFISDEYMAYMLKYDTVHGKFAGEVTGADGFLNIDGNPVKVFAERDPANICWGDAGVDVVVESTGVFTSLGKAQVHLDQGAKKVLHRDLFLRVCLTDSLFFQQKNPADASA